MQDLEKKIEIEKCNIEFLKNDIAWMQKLKKSIQATENKGEK